MSAQFKIKAADPASVVRLERELGLPRFIAATLVARGIDNPAAVHRFLAPSLERDWLDPYIIPGLSDVADALEAAVKRGDHILVFGDFDLDGISATTVLTRGLRALGAQATPFIPLRFEEGYALSQAAITRACSFGPDFIVTVDCGIACKAEAAAVVEAGLGLAITDHHEPVDLVPEGVPVADPKCDANCPSSILAGVGVALKLVQVLGGRLGQPHLWRDFTDFATLGTVADLMPMRDENRALVSDGIARMNAAPRPCIAAAGARPADDRRLRGGEPPGHEAGIGERPAPRHRSRAVRDREGAGRRDLPRPARAGGVGRELARGREGHRGKPPGEHVRRAQPAVHHRRRRSARQRPQRGPGQPVLGCGKRIRPAHALRRARCGRGRHAAGRQAAGVRAAPVRLHGRAARGRVPSARGNRLVRQPRRADAGQRGATGQAGAVRPGASRARVPGARRDAGELPRGGRREEPLLVLAVRRARHGVGHHVPLLGHRIAHAHRQRGERRVRGADRRMARPQVGEGHAAVAGSRAHLRRPGGLPQPREPQLRGRPVRHERRRAVRERAASPRGCGGLRGGPRGEPRLLGAQGRGRPRGARAGRRACHHRRQAAARRAARDPRASARRALHAGHHGHGARQIADLPGARRHARAGEPRGQPVRVPAARADR